ncbi:MAG TPA: MltA domain-containing protein, partial [Burkholderiaceae bacterium]|nr:MltA domain-containing protein [Burkholderiaceae bacterium]
MSAWPAWLSSCQAFASSPNRPQAAPWHRLCDAAQQLRPQTAQQVRSFFSQQMDRYRVVALDDDLPSGTAPQRDASVTRDALPREHTTGLVTGYFEPVLEGSRQRVDPFVVPVYRRPALLPTATRAALETSGQLRGQELLWVRDPLEAFVLEVQGSGRVHLTDGSVVRLAYAANNGHAYRSVGRWLLEQGELAPQDVSLQSIIDWAHTHPQRVRELLDQNPRMVFFRELALGDATAGPVGTLG